MVQGIKAYKIYDVKQKNSQKRASLDVSSKPVRKTPKDSYTPSPERQKFLDSVKSKIKSGYYTSEEVIDDLSTSFAGAFDTALS